MKTKTHINVFFKEKVGVVAKIVEKTKNYLIIIILFLLVSFVGLFAAKWYFETALVQKTAERDELSTIINAVSSKEKKVTELLQKKELLKTYLKDDAQFLPYFTLLKEILAPLNAEKNLQSFSVDKNQLADFTLQFATVDEVEQFLAYMETEVFLKNFTSVQLKDFSISPGVGNSAIDLRFQGQFTKRI